MRRLAALFAIFAVVVTTSASACGGKSAAAPAPSPTAAYSEDVVIAAVRSHRSSDLGLRDKYARDRRIFAGLKPWDGPYVDEPADPIRPGSVTFNEVFTLRCLAVGVSHKAIEASTKPPGDSPTGSWSGKYDGSGHWDVEAVCPYDSAFNGRWSVAEADLSITPLTGPR